MGKAELTDPWGGQGVEGGEGEAGSSLCERRRTGQQRRFTGGEVEVISAQDEWDKVGPGPKQWPALSLPPGPGPGHAALSLCQPPLLRGSGTRAVCLYVGDRRRVSESSRGRQKFLPGRKTQRPL